MDRHLHTRCMCLLFPATNFVFRDTDCVPVTLLKYRSCGYRAQARVIMPKDACNLSRYQAVPLRQRIKEHDQLLQRKPRNNNLALLSSCQNREVSRILQPLTCGHHLQMSLVTSRMRWTMVVQNRRVPTQLSEKK